MTARVTVETEVDELVEFTDAAVPVGGGVPAATTSGGRSTFDLDRMVVLDDDVAAVFKNARQVNAALRAILNVVPKPRVVPPAEAV